MKNIKNIIFDFDGVLVKNTELLLTLQGKVYGFTIEDQRRYFKKNTAEESVNYPEEKNKIFWKEWKKVLENSKIENEEKDFLEKNKDKKLFIISSNKEEILEMILKSNSLENYFSEVFGKETNPSKIEKFLILKEKYNLDFSKTLFITDSSGDLKEANNFEDLIKIAVTWGIHDREYFEKENPDLIIDDWNELKI